MPQSFFFFFHRVDRPSARNCKRRNVGVGRTSRMITLSFQLRRGRAVYCDFLHLTQGRFVWPPKNRNWG